MRDDATDEYCVILCATQDCPLDLCKCADTPTMEEVKAAATKEAAEAEIQRKLALERYRSSLNLEQLRDEKEQVHPYPSPSPSPSPNPNP